MKMKRTLITALAAGAVALGQQTSSSKDVSNISNVIRALDFGVFGGFSGYKLSNGRTNLPVASELEEGGLFGFRVGASLTQHLGIEGAYSVGVNNLYLFSNANKTGFGARNQSLTVNPIWSFATQQSRLRPYVTAGFGGMWFNPTSAAKSQGATAPYAQLGASHLTTRLEPAFNWGGGLKWSFTKAMNLRFDARNVWAKNPHFGVPGGPLTPGGFYIAPGGWQNGVQVTAGLGFTRGGAVAAPSGPKIIHLKLDGDTSPVTVGQTRPITASVDGPSSGMTINWTLNGSKVNGDDSRYTFDSSFHSPGVYKLCANADAKGWSPASDCVDITIVEPVRNIAASVAADQARVRVGTPAALRATSDLPSSATPTYAWTVNGQPVSASGSTFAFDTANVAPGTYNICSTVSAPGYTPSQKCTQVVVEACGNPTISITGSGSTEIGAGETAKVPASAAPNACGTPVKVAYKASEGAILPDGTFDSSSVTFDRTGGQQRKTVVVTATATDEKGNTATTTSNVVVKFTPLAQRVDDVVFAAASARVNNCGKRLLLEVLAAKLNADPTGQVVLIGHMSKAEARGVAARAKGKGKARSKRTVAAAALDKARVMNAAAVISAGTGICTAVDLSHVKVGYAGTDNSSEPMLGFCGTSVQGKGRKQPDTTLDQRRVEVWWVPTGAALPQSAATLADAPAAAIKAKGCPK